MLHLLSLVVTLFFLPLTLATAASQFHLNVNTDISRTSFSPSNHTIPDQDPRCICS